MSNLIVVLMGGLSGERKISFLTGKACSDALKKKGYKVIDLDAKGYFVEELKKLQPKIVFNALHGKYGEDGFVQSILEALKIPYTHSGVLASSLAMDKELSRIIFNKNKLIFCRSTTNAIIYHHLLHFVAFAAFQTPRRLVREIRIASRSFVDI